MFLEDQLMKFKITETEPLPDLNTQPYQIPPKSIILNACDTNGNCFDDFIALYPRAHGNLSQWCEYSPHSLSKLAWQASRLGTTYLVPPPEPFPDSPFDWDSDFTRSGSEEHKQHYIAYLFTSKGRGFNVSSAPCEVLANTKIALADLERQLGVRSTL
ncbi:hypothetical protein N7G274_008303 [Stereocaulon virgatum]|uniref:CHAT domain-containing protein n=1 Tax=Stereocaulon virgatum TaxID=373712 RepID=A0ABR4A6J3_9LECA